MLEIEKKIIDDYKNGISVRDIAFENGGTEEQIRFFLYKNNIKRGFKRRTRTKWSKKDIEFLKTLYKTSNISVLCDLLNRPVISIRTKANKLGLYKDERHFNNKNKLREHIIDSNYRRKYQEIIDLYNSKYNNYKSHNDFINDNKLNINVYILRNIIKRYNLPEIILFDVDMYMKIYKNCNNVKECGELMSLHTIQVNHYVNKYNLPKIKCIKVNKVKPPKNTGKKWTTYQINKLKKIYPIYTTKECAIILDRTFESIKSAVKRHNIKK